MKLKGITSIVLSITLALSVGLTANASDTNTLEIGTITNSDSTLKDEYDDTNFEIVEEETEIVFDGIAPYSSTITKKYSINWTVKAGSESVAATKVYMSTGDQMIFDLKYTPTNAEIHTGVKTPRGTFRNYTDTNGTVSHTMTMNENGIFQMKIRNDSTKDVTFSGIYSFTATSPFDYMFKSPKMATYISSKYGEVRSDGTHYALDITTGVAGEIENYPVYNTLTGTVIKNGYFSDNKTTCVAITHTNGYTSRFLHMDLTNNGVTLNGNAATGKQIGKVSNKGCSAFHLHIDVNTANTYDGPSLTSSNTVDPQLLFPNISFT